MTSGSQHYPDHLNPFGDDADEEETGAEAKAEEYPDYLSPFGCEGEEGEENDDSHDAIKPTAITDDYDNSLNPFGLDDDADDGNQSPGYKNPFDDEDEDDAEQKDVLGSISTEPLDSIVSSTNNPSIQLPETSLEPPPPPPPIPLPRTKSLLKKEKALRERQQQLDPTNQDASSIATSTSSSTNIPPPDPPASTDPNDGSLQKRKVKRNAPPVPINFKRPVLGSIDEIETELNDLGDKLALIETESLICQDTLRVTHNVDDEQFTRSKSKFGELIKRKNSIIRRQKELMYKKRELKLDQFYSDIEYELRMIGNKQKSHRTAEDEAREKELLKKLVEIVEEKNDIVENLNKEAASDSQDLEEALRRLNITPDSVCKAAMSGAGHPNSKSSILNNNNSNKSKSCDKSGVQVGMRQLSKIATMLPKGSTIKNSVKMKRKHLFKKSVK